MLAIALILVQQAISAPTEDVADMFAGADQAHPWGWPVPAILKSQCANKGKGLSMCLASDEAVNSKTRSQTQWVFCNGRLSGMVGYFYGAGARDTAMVMTGVLVGSLGQGAKVSGGASWYRSGTSITIGPNPSRSDSWMITTIASVETSKCL